MLNNQYENLLDENMNKKIKNCFINSEGPFRSRLFVIYEDNSRENIWTYKPQKYQLDRGIFTGKTKIEAVFYCDRACSIRSVSQF